MSAQTGAPRLLTVEQVAHSLGIARSRVWAMTAANEIRSVKVGRSRRVRVEDLQAYVDGLVAAQAGDPTGNTAA